MAKSKMDLTEHILPVSATLLGVAITVLTLFSALKLSRESLADEILAFCSLLFALACLFSYLSLRKGKSRLETAADILFFIGVALLVAVSFLLLFVVY